VSGDPLGGKRRLQRMRSVVAEHERHLAFDRIAVDRRFDRVGAVVVGILAEELQLAVDQRPG
jgi:hypothetical protein